MKNYLHDGRCAAVLVLLGISISSGQVSVSLPATEGQSGMSINIPLVVGTVTGLGVTSFQFVMTFDTAIVIVTGVDGAGTLSANFTTVPNLTYPGQLRVASAGITPIVGSGTLILLKAQLKRPGVSGLIFTDFRFNEGSPLATATNGKVTVMGTDDVENETSLIPSGFNLSQNYPNPFNPTTTIGFDVPAMSYVSLEIYDLIGVHIRTLVGDRRMSAGHHAVSWNGLDERGVTMPSGTYVYRIRAGDYTSSRKMILLK